MYSMYLLYKYRNVLWAWCSVCWHKHVCHFFLKSKLSLSESNISSCWAHDRTRTTLWYAMVKLLICHGCAEKWHVAGVFPRVWVSTRCPRFGDACLHAFTDEMIHNISCRHFVAAVFKQNRVAGNISRFDKEETNGNCRSNASLETSRCFSPRKVSFGHIRYCLQRAAVWNGTISFRNLGHLIAKKHCFQSYILDQTQSMFV